MLYCIARWCCPAAWPTSGAFCSGPRMASVWASSATCRVSVAVVAVVMMMAVPGYPRYKMVGEEEAGEFSLEISRLDTEDDAVFQCQVRPVTCHVSRVTRVMLQVSAMGDVGAIRSSPAQVSVVLVRMVADMRVVLQVSVMSPPGRPVILTPRGGHAGTVTVAAGEELQLQCVSSGGRPAAEVGGRISASKSSIRVPSEGL